MSTIQMRPIRTFPSLRNPPARTPPGLLVGLLLPLWLGGGNRDLYAIQATDFNKSQLVAVEDLSESLANSLLDFSVKVRDRDQEAVALFFADRVQSLTFSGPGETREETVRWLRHRHVDFSGGSGKPTSRGELIEEWASFLNSFSSLEDVRFKVKDARFSGPAGKVRAESGIKFFLVGRNLSGGRLWVKGTGRVTADRTDEGPWVMSRILFDHLDSYQTDAELFSEVSRSSGVSVSLPPYGSPGSDDFVYHGAAAGDLDQDGWLDLVVTSVFDNFIYLNQRDGTFKPAGWQVGVSVTPQPAVAPVLLDYDNDGDLDIFFSAVGDQMLFRNDLIPTGRLSFLDVSAEAGVALPALGFGATAGDVNGDGWVDIHVASYNRFGRVMPNSWEEATNGTPNLLFVNQGNGRFLESGRAWGLRDRRWGYAAQFADVNGDGRQDLYLVNDFGPNSLFLNRGDRFEDEAAAFRASDPGNGMGVSFGDYNNDGRLDIYVSNMSSTAGNRILTRLFPEAGPEAALLQKFAAGNTLLEGGLDGRFQDVTARVGPFQAGWAWGGVFIDFDNDGWQDLYSSSGLLSGKLMKDT